MALPAITLNPIPSTQYRQRVTVGIAWRKNQERGARY